jgi:hypothetical protein
MKKQIPVNNLKLLAVLLAGLFVVVLSAPSAQATPPPATPHPLPAIAGNIHPDGSIGEGSGFTCQHLGPGQYFVTFPANTWNGRTLPIVVATPIFVVGPVNLTVFGYEAGEDGSLIVVFDNSGVDLNFFFIVMQS